MAFVSGKSWKAGQILTTSRLDDATNAEAAAAGVKPAQPLSQNRYKVDLLRAVITEELTVVPN